LVFREEGCEFEEAMERERLEVEGKDVDLGEVRFEDVGNRESLVLE
jgi:hypothetical protein